MTTDKDILCKKLDQLLGFGENDDGGSLDVLEHLLTIESREDLLEYISQLLGAHSPTVLEFVDNVGRCQRGESLVWSNAESSSEIASASQTIEFATSTTKTVPSTSNNKSLKSDSTVGQAQPKRANTLQARKGGGTRVRNKSPKSRNTGVKISNNSASGNNVKPSPSTASKQQKPMKQSQPTSANTPPAPAAKTFSKPARGKAKIFCGCFGTMHKALTNCLFCGRISCSREGYDYCPFCGFMVEQVIDDGSHANDPAWAQKERLLRFDKEFARRTQIVDDQADFQGVAGSTAWMTASEEDQALQQEMDRQDALNHRPKQTLNIAM